MQSTVTDGSSPFVRDQARPPQEALPCCESGAGHAVGKGATDAQIEAIYEALAAKVGQQKFRIWFKNSTEMALADGYLKVSVPNSFIASWIENHFANEISQAVRSVIGASVKVTFTVNPDLSGHQGRAPLDSQGSAATAPQAGQRPQFHADPRRKKPAEGRERLKFSLDTFVVGSSNELAYNAAKVVVNEQQSPFNPLFIHGGYGVGKTHLLQGICNAVLEKRPVTRWFYLSAEDFANQFVLALKTRKLETFRGRMRQTDLLVIDDIHFLASKPSTQEEFLHTFNTIELAGKQVVLASDAHPKMIGQLSEKLVNRFVSGMVVKVDTPDLHTRCQICRQYIKSIKTLSTPVPDSVIEYVAENLRTNVRELEGALLKLIAYSALKNEKISVSTAKAILAEHLERCDPIAHVSDIESAVASYFGVTPATMRSPKKDRTVALARHFGMYLTRKHTKMSSSEIGRVMGNKNHATVLLACKKIEEMVQRNAELRWLSETGNRIAKAKTVLTQLEESISR